MIRIMDDSKTLTSLVTDKTNGIGNVEAISAEVVEELNGLYELYLTVASTSNHFNDIKNGSILKVNAGEIEGEQLFRVVKIGKPLNNIVEIYCQHITYDLNKVLLMPFEAKGIQNVVKGFMDNMVGTHPFTLTSDIINTTTKFVSKIPRSFREALGGYEGSLLDQFRGEYIFDNLDIKYLERRGVDTDIKIAYGKNMTDLKQEESIENMFDAILGYVVVNEVTYQGTIQYLTDNRENAKIRAVDLSDKFAEETVPTTAQIDQEAMVFARKNHISSPYLNVEVSFVALWQTEEYKNIAPLERIGLGDEITIEYKDYGIEDRARVIKRTWDVLNERYKSLEIGEPRATIVSAISSSVTNPILESAKNQTSKVAERILQMGDLISNGLGLFITTAETETGGLRYYLHNKPNLADSDIQYIYSAEGFVVSTDYGRTWNAGFDSEGNAVLNVLDVVGLNADWVNAGTMTADHIKGGLLELGGDDDSYGTLIAYGPASDYFTLKLTNTGLIINYPDLSIAAYLRPEGLFLYNKTNRRETWLSSEGLYARGIPFAPTTQTDYTEYGEYFHYKGEGPSAVSKTIGRAVCFNENDKVVYSISLERLVSTIKNEIRLSADSVMLEQIGADLMNAAITPTTSGAAAYSVTLAGNIKVQFGYTTLSHKTAKDIVFDTPFDDRVFYVGAACVSGNFNAGSTISITNQSKTGFKVYQFNTSSVAMNINWFAIGK